MRLLVGFDLVVCLSKVPGNDGISALEAFDGKKVVLATVGR